MKPLMNFRPILFGAISFIIGILSAFFFFIEKAFVSYILISVFVLALSSYLAVSILKKYKIKSTVIFSVIFLVVALLGSLFSALKFNDFEKAKMGEVEVTVEGTVGEIAPINGGYYLLIRDAKLLGDEEKELKYSISAYYYGDFEFRLGNTVKFKSIMSDTNDYFDGEFQKYNLAEGIRYRVTLTSSDIIVTGDNLNLFVRTNLLIRDTLKLGLDDTEFTIAYALLCGNSELMNDEIISSYRQAGVAHIFAVSGLHIGFLATILNFILKKLRVKGFTKATIITIVLIFYSGVCGFSASSIRATVMSAVMLFASATGKKYDALSAISLSSVIVLLIAPFQMLCAGFQLSYVVSVGLILLVPKMRKLFTRLPKKIGDSISVALVAQIVGIPVMLANFGEFSLISILANIILIPIVSVLYVLLFVGVILSAITTLPNVFLFVQNYLIKGLNYAITAIDYKIFIVGGFTLGVFILLYYAIMAFCAGLFNLSKMAKLIIIAILSVVLIVGTVVYNVAYKNSFKAYVVGSSSFQGAVISSGENKALIINYAEFDFNDKALNRALSKLNIDRVNLMIILRNGKELNAVDVAISAVACVKTDKLIYCDDYNKSELGALGQLIHDTEIQLVEDSLKFTHNGLDFEIFAGGYCLEISNEKGNVLFVSKTDYAPMVKHEIDGNNYTFVVCSDNQSELRKLVITKNFISYLSADGCKDAENNGNYFLKFG